MKLFLFCLVFVLTEGFQQSATTKRLVKQDWPFWPVLPIAPYGKRKTIRSEIVKNEIWAFDQCQGVLYVHVPIRMLVAKIDQGLLCYSPVAPTEECLMELRNLEKEQKEVVSHIILPTLAIEHKVFFGRFCAEFPKAKCWYTPGQYSFPLNFNDLTFLGLTRAKVLNDNKCEIPGIKIKTLGPIVPPGNGGFGETAVYHINSKSLFLVDTVVKIPKSAPAIIDKKCLLFHARDDVRDTTTETQETLNKGWRRLSLFAFFFQPAAVDVVPVPECVFQANSGAMKGQFGWFDLYPFEWNTRRADKAFEALAKPKLLVAPILQELILNRAPQQVLQWVDDIAREFNFVRILPCHLAPEIIATPSDFRKAFAFLSTENSQFPIDDLSALRDAEVGLVASGDIFPRPPLVKNFPLSTTNSTSWWAFSFSSQQQENKNKNRTQSSTKKKKDDDTPPPPKKNFLSTLRNLTLFNRK